MHTGRNKQVGAISRTKNAPKVPRAKPKAKHKGLKTTMTRKSQT